MFTMMNVARLLVGMEGVALSDIAYQTALSFAKDRRQGRSLDKAKNDPEASADCIMVHPDVRRMLMNIKSTNEAMRGLALWAGMQIDVAHNHEDEQVRQDADDLVALITPSVKSFLTEQGFQNINDALQICGGSGYTTDWCIEQYMRDARISLIYEGTNHIQALDLVGRKLPRGQGRLYMKFNQLISDLIKENKDNEAMAEFINPLKEASKMLGAVTMNLSMKGMQDPEEAAAVASPYLNLFGYVALSYIWCLMVKECLQRGDDSYAQTRIKVARFYFQNILPNIHSLQKVIESGKANMMDLSIDEF